MLFWPELFTSADQDDPTGKALQIGTGELLDLAHRRHQTGAEAIRQRFALRCVPFSAAAVSRSLQSKGRPRRKEPRQDARQSLTLRERGAPPVGRPMSYAVFRELQARRRGVMILDMDARTIPFEPMPEEDVRRYGL